MTRVGGLDLSGEAVGTIALNELVLHGWDLAVAIGQPFAPTPEAVAACTTFMAPMAEPRRAAARQGRFGPVVSVPDGATPFERLLCLSGRNPSWSPTATD